MTRAAAVLGSPIAHSLSPALHRAAYAHLGLDWTYEARECDVAALPGLIAGLGPEWAGLSLTMPLKAAVLTLLDDVDPVARQTGAANTVILRDGRRYGANTDVPGLAAALAERGIVATGPGSILGGGATARSAVASLVSAGWTDITVYARRPDALPTGSANVQVRSWADAPAGLSAALVVATVPAGAADGLADAVPAQPGTLFDVVYDPWPTALAARWAERGGAVLGGLDLLVHQAALQVILMTGTQTAAAELVPVMRAAGEAALAARAG